MLMTTTPHLFYMLAMLLALSNVFLLIFGLTGIKIFTKLVEIPKGRLMPLIIILSITGAYSINGLIYDIYWMIGFGVVGYILKQYGYPPSPMVLGIILGELMETNFRRAYHNSRGLGNAILQIFTRPISLVLFLIIVYSMVTQTRWYKQFMASRRMKSES
jgi:putative tricarboxylic transport membrane protein